MTNTPAALLILLLGSASALSSQDSGPVDPGSRLDREIPRLMEAGGIPGLSAALVLDGQIVWNGAFGVADEATGQPVTEHTVFQAASLTKQVFAYTALRLADRGVLDLDTPLSEYLDYPRLEGETGYSEITARHVLSHSSGLPNWGGDRLELAFEPGGGFNYSGEGYVFLQRTLEHLTGDALDILVEREVLEPLGLHDSWIFWRPEFETRAAARHDDWGISGGVARIPSANAASSFLTTGEDYARILVAIMEGQGLDPATFREALEPQVQVASRSQIETSDKLYWGLGWGLQMGSAGRAMWQWGHNGGFRAYLLAFPDRQDAFVYFANSDAGLSIARSLLEIVGDAAGWQPDEHWALTWLDYEPHDSPRRVARRDLVDTFRERGVEAGLARYDELYEAQPDLVNDPFSASVGRALGSVGETEAAIAVLTRNVELNPRSGNSLSVLGDVSLQMGRYEEAFEAYSRVLVIRPGHRIAANAQAWTESVIAAIQTPPAVAVADLERFAGDYGPRHVTLQNGVLFYQREGNPQYRLRPLTTDSFFLEGLGTFRVRFVSDAAGKVTKLVGSYVEGNRDESLRTP